MEQENNQTDPEEDPIKKLFDLVDNNVITPKQLIKIIEDGVRDNKCDPEILTFVNKYLILKQKIKSSPNKCINVQEIIDVGIYDSMEDLTKVIEEDYDHFKNHIKFVEKEPVLCKYPEPTEQEIKENIDYSFESSKPGESPIFCTLCTHRKNTTVNIPCGHSLLCTPCAKEMVINGGSYNIKCPVCRNIIEKIQKIFK
jgi:hypothetical protein